MTRVIFGNHASVLVPRQDRDSIRKLYCDVLGGRIMKADPERDFICLGENFYVAFLYGDVADESAFLRSSRAIWLEIKSDNVKEISRKIVDSGLVRKLDVPDPHLYFQAPGGQCLRLVGIDEDLSFYEGAGEGPNVGKVKEAVKRLSRNHVVHAIADVKRGLLLATTDIAAPPERAFRAVASEELARWWGFGVTRYSGDARVGGAWRTEGVGDDGKPFAVHGDFLEVEPPRELVQTAHHWEPRGLVTTIRWHFEGISGGTRVVVRHEGFGDAQESCAAHADGWERILDRLSEHVGATA